MKKFLRILLFLVIIVGAVWCFSFFHKSNPKNYIKYNTDNVYISDKTKICAHRSGGGEAPEETLMAFEQCANAKEYEVGVFEFDLHLTKDNVLVLLHDDVLDTVSDCEEVFGVSDCNVGEYTYEELRTLNMGAKFVAEDGTMPYAKYSGENVPDNLRIQRVEDVLDYLISQGNYNYIIEIKNSGDNGGRQAVDMLYQILKERNVLEKTIFGTFNEEITEYVDEFHPDMTRSASIAEVATFWKAALLNQKDFTCNYDVLQIPYTLEYRLEGINLATTTVINYAHEHNIAVQYWTINDEKTMRYLESIGADGIISDYPELVYGSLNN